MHDRTRKIEILAEPGPQTGRADALGADHRIALENERFDARSGGFASGGSPGRPTSDDQKFDVLHVGGTL